jgi:hypothetical protein
MILSQKLIHYFLFAEQIKNDYSFEVKYRYQIK